MVDLIMFILLVVAMFYAALFIINAGILGIIIAFLMGAFALAAVVYLVLEIYDYVVKLFKPKKSSQQNTHTM